MTEDYSRINRFVLVGLITDLFKHIVVLDSSVDLDPSNFH